MAEAKSVCEDVESSHEGRTASTSLAPSGGHTPVKAALRRSKGLATQEALLAPGSGRFPMQQKEQGESNDVPALAAQGTQGTGGTLPYLEQIQKSFGRHDISNVKAYQGEAARAAAVGMGAEAYATGDKVAFSGPPSLRTAAHEAAHVIQQQGGVSLKGGVGETGDTYEQHADQVADLVVQGKSAEGLLDEHAGSGGVESRGAVQRKEVRPAPSIQQEDVASGTQPLSMEEMKALSVEIYEYSLHMSNLIAHVVGTFSAPPNYAEMDALHALLVDYESYIQSWRPAIMALDGQRRHETAEDVALECPDLDEITSKLRDTFQQAVMLYFDGSDTYNYAEIQREHEIAGMEPKQRLRSAPPRNTAHDDRDWRTIHIPGLTLAIDPITSTAMTPKPNWARTADQIDAVVIHTGGTNNARTVRTLNARGLSGHYSIEEDGATIQMRGASQVGAHAGIANRASVAIDLAYEREGTTAKSAQAAFLMSGQQLIAAAKIVTSHARLSPRLKDGGSHARGELIGAGLGAGHIQHMQGAYGGVAVYPSSGKAREAAAESISGVVAHQSLPDSDHADPGEAYMLRLYTIIPVLEAYERRYGPIQVNDPKEVERVIGVIERYEQQTGKAAGAVSQHELWRMVQEKFKGKALAEVGSAELNEAFNEALTELKGKLEEARHASKLKKVRGEERERLSDVDIVYKHSHNERDYLRAKLALDKNADPYDVSYRSEVEEIRATSDYAKKKADFRKEVEADLAKMIVRDSAYVDAMEQNLADFRVYLATHLPELLSDD